MRLDEFKTQFTKLRYPWGTGGAKVSYSKLAAQLGVNQFYLFHIDRTEGYKPPVWVCEILGIDVELSAVLPVGGNVPAGTMVAGLLVLTCPDCRKPFIPNAGNRKRCYICSPYKGKRRR